MSVRLEELGAISVSGEGRWDEQNATANVIAFKKAFDVLQNGGKISVGPGIFFLNEEVTIPTNIWIDGVGTCNPDDANIKGIVGTVFRPVIGSGIPAIFQSDIKTRSIRLSNFSVIGGRKQDGIIYDAPLTTGVYLVGINHTVDNVLVAYISGDGIRMGNRFITSPPYYWIFQVENCRVVSCGGYGLRVDTTDGFVSGNLFTGNVKGNISFGGGNIWQGNHFDNAHSREYAALTIEDHLGEQIITNYFDRSAVALRIVGESLNGSASYNGAISENKFRANSELDIHLIGIRNPVLDQLYSNKGGFPGRQTSYSIRFDNCIGRKTIRNATWANCWGGLDVVDPFGQQAIQYLNCIQAGVLL